MQHRLDSLSKTFARRLNDTWWREVKWRHLNKIDDRTRQNPAYRLSRKKSKKTAERSAVFLLSLHSPYSTPHTPLFSHNHCRGRRPRRPASIIRRLCRHRSLHALSSLTTSVARKTAKQTGRHTETAPTIFINLCYRFSTTQPTRTDMGIIILFIFRGVEDVAPYC